MMEIASRTIGQGRAYCCGSICHQPWTLAYTEPTYRGRGILRDTRIVQLIDLRLVCLLQWGRNVAHLPIVDLDVPLQPADYMHPLSLVDLQHLPRGSLDRSS